MKMYCLHSNNITFPDVTILSDEILQSSFRFFFSECKYFDTVMELHDNCGLLDNDMSPRKTDVKLYGDTTFAYLR